MIDVCPSAKLLPSREPAQPRGFPQHRLVRPRPPAVHRSPRRRARSPRKRGPFRRYARTSGALAEVPSGANVYCAASLASRSLDASHVRSMHARKRAYAERAPLLASRGGRSYFTFGTTESCRERTSVAGSISFPIPPCRNAVEPEGRLIEPGVNGGQRLLIGQASRRSRPDDIAIFPLRDSNPTALRSVTGEREYRKAVWHQGQFGAETTK